MCGLVAVFDSAGIKSEEKPILSRMLQTLTHRGPDAAGEYIQPTLFLGHRRLSIIDQSGGVQPMKDVTTGVALAFNGEIFNFIELREELSRQGIMCTSQSDTEVLLRWFLYRGPAGFADLNGQFSCVFWDPRKQHLIFARDRFGIAPLFYTQIGSRWLFASEIKALVKSGWFKTELDMASLSDIAVTWAPIGNATAFKNVYSVLPGHYGILTASHTFSSQPFHTEPFVRPEKKASILSLKELTEKIGQALEDSVRIRLRADVPIAAYLSGGLDSSITTALIRRLHGERLDAFSLQFEHQELDESLYQAAMAKALGVRHHTVRVSDEDVARNLVEGIFHTEVPTLRSAPIPMGLLSRFVQQAGFKVVMTGEGADEFFIGYDLFKETKVRAFWGSQLNSTWRPALLNRLYPYLAHSPTASIPYWRKLFTENSIKNGHVDLIHDLDFSHRPRWLTGRRLLQFLGQRWHDEALSTTESGLEFRLAHLVKPLSRFSKPMDRAQQLEIDTLLANYLLSTQGDRMLMWHSIEGRFPFLDHSLTNILAEIPSHLKMPGLREKYLLKLACSENIPELIMRRPKVPYRGPDGRSFTQGYGRDLLEHFTSPGVIKNCGYFDEKRVEFLKDKLYKGRAIGFADHMALMWILTTQIWHAIFVDGINVKADIPAP
ncbi:MAG: asparagine synthase (glutamine-hydrolyzing) [Pseudomonadota bacterium]